MTLSVNRRQVGYCLDIGCTGVVDHSRICPATRASSCWTPKTTAIARSSASCSPHHQGVCDRVEGDYLGTVFHVNHSCRSRDWLVLKG